MGRLGGDDRVAFGGSTRRNRERSTLRHCPKLIDHYRFAFHVGRNACGSAEWDGLAAMIGLPSAVVRGGTASVPPYCLWRQLGKLFADQ